MITFLIPHDYRTFQIFKSFLWKALVYAVIYAIQNLGKFSLSQTGFKHLSTTKILPPAVKKKKLLILKPF